MNSSLNCAKVSLLSEVTLAPVQQPLILGGVDLQSRRGPKSVFFVLSSFPLLPLRGRTMSQLCIKTSESPGGFIKETIFKN